MFVFLILFIYKHWVGVKNWKTKNHFPDTICCFDCELMPRLQHIRVAGKYFVDFEIPNSFEALWRYMYHMYQLDAFTQSCPADQDIINHYKLQQAKGDVKQMKINKHEELETPTFTTSIPIDIAEWAVDLDRAKQH